jgi:hypothetical protein
MASSAEEKGEPEATNPDAPRALDSGAPFIFQPGVPLTDEQLRRLGYVPLSDVKNPP